MLGNKKIFSGPLNIFLLLLFALALFSCETESEEKEQRGDIVYKGTLMALSYSMIESQLDEFDIPEGFDFEYSVTVNRIHYLTEDENGELVTASGALYAPVDANTFMPVTKAFPLLSIQHGTQTHRDSVASVGLMNSPEAILGVIAGMSGYLTVIPDYLGLGVSESIHPYIHAELTANAVIDMLRAARNYCDEGNIALNDELLLTGYSEGGYATLATQKYLESYYSDEFTITGAAPMAGPYNMEWTTDYMLRQERFNNPYYFGYILVAYNDIYGWNNLTGVFKSPYAERINALFDGTHGGKYINSQLTYSVADLFKADFLSSYMGDGQSDIKAAMRENSLLDFKPQAPILLIHSSADQDVPYENSVQAKEYFQSQGADVEFITIPELPHFEAALLAYPAALIWLASLLN
jgi:pimeloyl-ACP methyl ester carboxylesterase